MLAVSANALLLLATLFGVQAQPQPDPWLRLRNFVGTWEGTAKGQAGNGTVHREYAFILADKFLHGKNRSTYPPQEKNARGEVHENWDLFSYDRSRRRLVLRQFHVEGFVNQYVLDPAQSTDTRLVFVSEAIENIAPGWRARETY